MNKRSFLQLLGSWAASLFIPRSPEPPRPKLYFFWVDEEFEVFVAPSIEDINACFDRQYAGDELTLANRGEVWGHADGEALIADEDGSIQTMREFVDELWQREWFRQCPCTQITTTYN